VHAQVTYLVFTIASIALFTTAVRKFDLWGTEVVLLALFCTLIPFLPAFYFTGEEKSARLQAAQVEREAFLQDLGEKTPTRHMRESEVRRWGPDATGGLIAGRSDQSIRLYCGEFFDGRKVATLQSHGKVASVDLKYCEKVGF
jgi:hypothetical protein